MANNQLIQGAALTGKKFLDVGAAVAAGYKGYTNNNSVNPRVAENEAIQSRVNSSMANMKTDMDFTSFSPSETKTMRTFLLSQRNIYTTAAKEAAKFDDTTDPEYMQYVDQMQNVNNSFTNLAKQLESYKTGKAEYAQGQMNGIYSNGTDGEVGRDNAVMYGFYDKDGKYDDTKQEGGYDSPFKIQDGGNIAFSIAGRELSYNDMSPPILKDYKLAKSLISGNETAFKAGKLQNRYSLDAYRVQLEEGLENQDTLKSMIFDFNRELDVKDLQDGITNGTMDMTQARDIFIDRMVTAREEVSIEGRADYLARNPTGEGAGKSYIQSKNAQEQIAIVNGYPNDKNWTGDAKQFNFKRQGEGIKRDTSPKKYYIARDEAGQYYIGDNKDDANTYAEDYKITAEQALKEFGITIPSPPITDGNIIIQE